MFSFQNKLSLAAHNMQNIYEVWSSTKKIYIRIEIELWHNYEVPEINRIIENTYCVGMHNVFAPKN